MRIDFIWGQRMTKSTIVFFCALLGFFSLPLSGCGGKGEEKGNGSAGDDRYGGTLVVGISGDIDGLNPVVATSVGASNVMGQIYMSLATMNKQMDFEPDVAESWEFSDDHLELTYHLR